MAQNSQAGENKIKDKENWLNEHGNPSQEFLQSLVDDGGPAALEKLRSIAEDLDAEYSPDDSAQKLIETIMSATRDNPNTTT